jgi:clan AA aspartic protease
MLLGQVRDNLPLVRLELPGLDGAVSVEVVVDTGFDGHFAFSRSIISRLDAERIGTELIALADSSRRQQDSYELMLDWFDDEIVVEVLEMEGNPLLGMRLLEGCRLTVEGDDGGEVVIEPL